MNENFVSCIILYKCEELLLWIVPVKTAFLFFSVIPGF